MRNISNRTTKNDIAWERLFNHFDIVSKVDKDGYYLISSSEINEIGKREARLMTKFDHRNNLPKLFRENKLSILPKSHRSYIIGRFKTHHPLQYDEVIQPIRKSFPREIDSIIPDKITSEAVALNVAYASGMIDEIIETGLDERSYLTLSGRLGSKKLEFNIDSVLKNQPPFSLTVNNSQIEIDASYENDKNIGLIEAKNKTPNDFLVRQLYYPYLFYKNLHIPKKIIPIFFTYAESVFSFHIYKFKYMSNYSSIKRVRQIDYILDTYDKITTDELKDIMQLSDMGTKEEDIQIPFPQANNFLRVLDLLGLLVEKSRSKNEISLIYGIHERQADYYYNALRYLGYAKKPYRGAPATITNKGRYINERKDTKSGKIQIIKDILSYRIFYECIEESLKQGKIISRESMKLIMSKYRIDLKNNKSTPSRRESTVRGWLNWILNVVTENDRKTHLI